MDSGLRSLTLLVECLPLKLAETWAYYLYVTPGVACQEKPPGLSKTVHRLQVVWPMTPYGKILVYHPSSK